MFATKKSLPFIFGILLFFSSMTQVCSRTVEKQTVLAVLTFNIASFTGWPERAFNHGKDTLNLCVFGDNVVQQAFEHINNKEIHNKTTHIINLLKLRKLNRCQVLYLSEPDQSKLRPLLAEIKDLPTLTVGENMSFLRAGGMVSLEKIKGKIQLSINLPMIKQSELEIDARLLNLANIVDFPARK